MVLGGATACTDFIEIDPENKVPEQGVDFTNKNNMYQPVVGAYSKVRTQGMHWCNALLMFTRDGDVWSGRTDDQGDAVAFGRKFNYNNSFWALNQVWMNFYDIIRITNAALQHPFRYIAPFSSRWICVCHIRIKSIQKHPILKKNIEKFP